MEVVVRTSSAAFLLPRIGVRGAATSYRNPRLKVGGGLCFSPKKAAGVRGRECLVVEAKKKKAKADCHSFIPKPDEATGPFPEAVLLKERKKQEDGKLLPEFADAEEAQLFEYLQLQMESDLNLERRRHYEVVYLIHENHAEEFDSVNEKIQDFLHEKKGKVWRLNDWGLRRLAYKIKKAKNARYILMNFELESNWINDFKSLLDREERVIRHLVMKRDKAETKDCPPPPEYHTLHAGIDDENEDDDDDDDDYMYYDDEDSDGIDLDDSADGVIEDEGTVITADHIATESSNEKPFSVSNSGRRDQRAENVYRQ